MAEKNGNGRWWITPALSVAMLLLGWGVGWGTNSSAVTRAAEDIKVLQASQRDDHDSMMQLKTLLPVMQKDIEQIKLMLQQRAI